MGKKFDVKAIVSKVGKGAKRVAPVLILVMFIGFLYDRVIAPALIASGVNVRPTFSLMRAV